MVFVPGAGWYHDGTQLYIGKTLATMILTFIAMLVIIFVVMLLFSLIGQVISFIESLYNEIMLRV